MNRFKYSLLCSAMAMATFTVNAATYDVVELSGVENTRYSYAFGVNNQGDVVGVSTEHFNFPINFERLNYSAIEADLLVRKESNPTAYENVVFEDIVGRQLNADSLDYLTTFLRSRVTDVTHQKIGDRTAFININGVTEELDLFDQFDAEFGGKTRSTSDLVNAINDSGWTVSSATDRWVYTSYTPNATEDEPNPEAVNVWSRNFLDARGVVRNGDQLTEIVSPESTYGGSSNLVDISNNGYVAGFATIGYSDNATTSLEACAELTDEVNQMRCAFSIRNDYASSSQRFYKNRAFRWQLDENMQVVEAKELDLAFTPKEDDNRTHLSAAFGVNAHGHVVGYSDGFRNESDFNNDRSTRQVATYWDETGVRTFIDQEKDSDRHSRTIAVNDNNIAVGYVEEFRNFDFIQRMFVYKANDNAVSYPNGFFSSSETHVKAINNHDMAVGAAEVENTVGSTRRKRGFIYNVQTDEITNINKLTACNSPYTIVEANDINDEGVIVGTALKNVQQLDSMGQPMVDDNGEAIMEEVTVAVKLTPIANGAVEDCSVTDDGEQTPTYERKGAGFGWLSVICLLSLMSVRRLVR